MQLLYFAWLKTRTGIGEEEVSPPPDVTTVRELLDWIRSRGGGYAEALSDLSVIKVAINQEFARPDDPVSPGDEVALFPPVTGG